MQRPLLLQREQAHLHHPTISSLGQETRPQVPDLSVRKITTRCDTKYQKVAVLHNTSFISIPRLETRNMSYHIIQKVAIQLVPMRYEPKHPFIQVEITSYSISYPANAVQLTSLLSTDWLPILLSSPDPRIDECFRVKSADYVNSGFDRGHMVPAADMAISQEAMQVGRCILSQCVWYSLCMEFSDSLIGVFSRKKSMKDWPSSPLYTFTQTVDVYYGKRLSSSTDAQQRSIGQTRSVFTISTWS